MLVGMYFQPKYNVLSNNPPRIFFYSSGIIINYAPLQYYYLLFNLNTKNMEWNIIEHRSIINYSNNYLFFMCYI